MKAVWDGLGLLRQELRGEDSIGSSRELLKGFLVVEVPRQGLIESEGPVRVLGGLAIVWKRTGSIPEA